LKIALMLRLFQAGVIAALMQCTAILLATLLIFSYAHHRIENLQVPADDPTALSLIPLLQLIYLLAAVGVAATRHRFVDLTAARIGLDAHGNGPRCAQISGPTVGARERSAPSISWWQTRAG
jgi:hypothetical protein